MGSDFFVWFNFGLGYFIGLGFFFNLEQNTASIL